MEFLQLIYFCDAAETENFSQTAKKFQVPSSSITQSIKRLEKEIGNTLFDRLPKGVELNERGKVFYNKAKTALDSLEDAKKMISEKEKESGKIRLLILSCNKLVCKAIKKFNKIYSEIKFDINFQLSCEKENLNSYDLIVTDKWQPLYENDEMVNYNVQELITEPISIAVHKDHPLAEKENFELWDLHNEKIITLNTESALYELLMRESKIYGFNINNVVMFNSIHMVAESINLGLGIGIVPSITWKDKFTDDVYLKKTDNLKISSLVVYSNAKLMKKKTKIFLDILFDIASDYGKE